METSNRPKIEDLPEECLHKIKNYERRAGYKTNFQFTINQSAGEGRNIRWQVTKNIGNIACLGRRGPACIHRGPDGDCKLVNMLDKASTLTT